MGGVYLSYSAYFLSIDFPVVFTIMNIVMVLLYLALGLTYGRSCLGNIKKIDENLAIMRDNDENIMKESLTIKRKMLYWIMVGTLLFCVTKVIDYGINNNLSNEFLQV